MKKQPRRAIVRQMTWFICAICILQSQAPVLAQSPPIQVVPSAQAAPPIPILSADQLDSLVAPIALYPDPLLSEVLAASTYPLEIVQAAQWLRQNSGLTGVALEDAAKQQDWDPSVQALVLFPDVLQRLSENIRWTTDLGNAFLAQQAGVMEAVQKMRSQALTSGNLTSTPQTVVTTQPQGATTIVEIQPANPQVIYVPVYDPLAIWGPAFYSYPVIYYPRTPVIIGSRLISFSTGVFVGSLFTGWNGWGGWGWRPNWFGRTVVVNNNFFYRYGYGRGAIGGNRTGGPAAWRHDPVHRWNVPYSNRLVETRFRNDVGRPQASRPQTVVRSAPPALAPRPAPAPNVSGPTVRAFVPVAPVPGVSRSAPDNTSRYNRPEPPQIAAPNGFNHSRGFPGDSARPSRQPVQAFRSSPSPAPQPSREHSRGEASSKHGTGERSARQGNRGR